MKYGITILHCNMALLLHCNIVIYISPTNNQGTNQPNIGSMCYHEVGLEVRIPIWQYTQRIIWNITFKKTHGLHEWVIMQFILHNTMTTLLRLMDDILRPFLELVYCSLLGWYFDF